MTIGIYLLSFDSFNHCYVGQSVNVELRYKKHCYLLKNRKHYNTRIDSIYNRYKQLPELHILETTDISNLTVKEDFWINEFDTLNNGLNMRTSEFTANNGVNASRSIFSREQILQVFELLVSDVYMPYKDISAITNVSTGIVSMIACGKVHSWLGQEYPEEYTSLISKINTRKSYQHSYGYVWPTLVSPTGDEYSDIKNLKEFARTHDLHYPSLQKVCRQTYGAKSINGWTIKNSGNTSGIPAIG
jgi:hypothetical protein